MPRARLVFLGSPEFAVPSLRALLEHPQIDVGLVVTQPDRRAGRGRTMQPPAVKAAAEAADVPVFQPATLRDPDSVERIRAERPDVMVVVSYGELLRRDVLELAPHGCLNVHPSLLPRYRGATPIPAAILNGDSETGITIMRLVRRLDAGPILFQHRVALGGDETTGALTDRLAREAARHLPGVVLDWVSGRITEQPQEDARATYTRELRKRDGQIDWSQPAFWIERLVRAMDPWPRAWTVFDDQRLTVHRVSVANSAREPVEPPGRVEVDDGSVLVAAGDGWIELREVQPAGRRVMPAADWIRGSRVAENMRFGSPEEPIPLFVETR